MANDIEIKLNSSNVPKVKEEMAKRAIVALEKCGLMAENYAKRNCTEKHIVDTGPPSQSTRTCTEDLRPYISAGARRKKWIFGTVGMAVVAALLSGAMTVILYRL